MEDVDRLVKRNGHAPPLPVSSAPVLPSLLIQLLPDGGVHVTGPVNQKTLCYGLLAQARDAIYEYRPSPIIPVG